MATKKVWFNCDIRQWVIPLGFAISKPMLSFYILCFSINYRRIKEA